MSKQITPRWFPSHSCWRVRKTINGKVITFTGGKGATGENDLDALALARTEINEQITNFSPYKTATPEMVAEMNRMLIDRKARNAQAYFGDVGQEARDLALVGEKHPLLKLQEENALLRSQLKQMGMMGETTEQPLKELQERYTAIQVKDAKAQGKHATTICEYKRASLAFTDFLAKRGITTTTQFDASAATVAEYRDFWIDNLANGCSHSLAKKSLAGAKTFSEWMQSREYISRIPPAMNRRWSSMGTDAPNPKYLTIKESRLVFRDAPEKLKLPILLSFNCAYRQSDLITLKRADIDLDKGIILRQRSKTGKPQAHSLWGQSKRLLQLHLDKTDGEPFAKGYTTISRRISEYMKGKVSQDPDARTAENIRMTSSNELEKLLKGKHPRLVEQHLGQSDQAVAKHYRDESVVGLFNALEKLEAVFDLK